MATKRQKKDAAKERIDEFIPTIPPIGPFALPSRILRQAERAAMALVESDPLGIITDDDMVMTREIINNPDIMMTPRGQLVNTGVQTIQTNNSRARESIRRSGQFDRANILPRFDVEVSPTKRTRKKTKTDKNMSKALRQANARFRKKTGQLRKGATQAKIMKYAHKLLRKMK